MIALADADATVLASTVTAIGSMLVALIAWYGRSNRHQHDQGQAAADRRHAEVLGAIKHQAERFDHHLEWHAEQAQKAPTTVRRTAAKKDIAA